MRWPLRAIASEAADTAAALSVFQDYCTPDKLLIGDCIRYLLGLEATLNHLDTSLGYVTNPSIETGVLGDLDIVIPSFQYTTGSCRNVFRDTPAVGYLRSTHEIHERYQSLWDRLEDDFYKEGSNLLGRLCKYSDFLGALKDACNGDSIQIDMAASRARLKKLLAKQEPHKNQHADPMHTLADTQYSHYYPPGHLYSRRPISFTYVSPSHPPPVPEAPPLSPTFSSDSAQSFSTTQTFGTGSSITEPKHWAKRIFDGKYGMSQLRAMPNRFMQFSTQCYGRDDPYAMDMLHSDGFHMVVDLPFEESTARISLYWRPSDHRARILFSQGHPRARETYCMPLTALSIRRDRSSLQLCRINRDDSKVDCWANLMFISYERMILFYDTAVAMKMQDLSGYHPRLQDILYPAEALEFGGEIRDGDKLYSLQMLRDADSNALRLEVTPRRGPMIKCPIWTAFIPPDYDVRRRVKRVDAIFVHLRRLHTYVFCDGYKPSRTPKGEIVLRFTQPKDAHEFVEACGDLLGRY